MAVDCGQGGGFEDRDSQGQGDRQRPGRGASLRGTQLRRHRLRIFRRGPKLRNNRVSIGEDLGNFQVAETIAKYPVGTAVTVYYNPLHPDQAVLERDLPKGLWGCLGIGTAIVLAIVFGSAIGLHAITEFVTDANSANRGMPPRPSPSARSVPRIALFALVLHRQASLAMKWPVVIWHDKTVRHRAVSRRAAGRTVRHGRIMYQRRVSYTYKHNNLTYTNTHATLASSVASTSSWLVRKSTTDYKNGASVQVWVNPDNPSQATLEPRAGFVWVLWLSAAAIWGVAYYAAVHG